MEQIAPPTAQQLKEADDKVDFINKLYEEILDRKNKIDKMEIQLEALLKQPLSYFDIKVSSMSPTEVREQLTKGVRLSIIQGNNGLAEAQHRLLKVLRIPQ